MLEWLNWSNSRHCQQQQQKGFSVVSLVVLIPEPLGRSIASSWAVQFRMSTLPRSFVRQVRRIVWRLRVCKVKNKLDRLYHDFVWSVGRKSLIEWTKKVIVLILYYRDWLKTCKFSGSLPPLNPRNWKTAKFYKYCQMGLDLGKRPN